MDDEWETFSSGKHDALIAEEIYTQLIGDGKKISKAIIAQHLAEILDSLADGQIDSVALEQDPNISYLIKAIKYASGNN